MSVVSLQTTNVLRATPRTPENAYRNTKNTWVCRICKNSYSRQLRADDPNIEERRKKDTEIQGVYLKKYRMQVIDAYGGKCACCGEKEYFFLTIDHVNNDGAEHRRQLSGKDRGGGGSTLKILRYIINNGYPSSFRILCYNCNCGRARNGGTCPHEET